MTFQFRNDTQQYELDVSAVNCATINISNLTPTYPVFADSNNNLVTYAPVPLPTSTFASFSTLTNNSGSYSGQGIAPFAYVTSEQVGFTVDPTNTIYKVLNSGTYIAQLSVPVWVGSNGNAFVVQIQDQNGTVFANCCTFLGGQSGPTYNGNFTLCCSAVINASANSSIEFIFQNSTGSNAFVNGVNGSILRIA